MRACGDQIGYGAARITTGDQALADEHRIGTRPGIRKQIGGAAYPRLGDANDIARQSRCDAREAIPIDVEGGSSRVVAGDAAQYSDVVRPVPLAV